jgi:hypothetical protein
VNIAGVPQESTLLFLIFIDDIKEIKLRGTLQLFVDDTDGRSDERTILKELEFGCSLTNC